MKIIMKSYDGSRKIDAIRAIRSILCIGLADAKYMIDSGRWEFTVPSHIAENYVIATLLDAGVEFEVEDDAHYGDKLLPVWDSTIRRLVDHLSFLASIVEADSVNGTSSRKEQILKDRDELAKTIAIVDGTWNEDEAGA